MKKELVTITFIIIFLLGAFLRLYDLDRRPIHHDEGVFSSFVDQILNTGYYSFEPEYHGPVMFYVSAFFMLIFGMQDFTLRFGTALLGVLMILLVWPLRRYLGDFGMLASAFFIATSSALVYYSRFSFHDVPFVFFYLLFVLCFFKYIECQNKKFLYISSFALAFMFSVKEVVHMLLPGVLSFFVFYGLVKCLREKFELGALIIINVLQISFFPALFYILNLNNIVNFINIKTDFNLQFIYFLIGIIFAAIIFLITLFSYNRCFIKRKNMMVDVKKYFIPMLSAFFITLFIFLLFYTAGFTHITDGTDRAINAPIKYNLQKIGEQTGHYKSFFYYAENLFLFESFVLMFSIVSLFLAKNLFIRFFIFISTYNFFLFSALSYKTPWHIVYIIAPLCITAGYSVQRAYDLSSAKRIFFYVIAIIFALIITFVSYQISFVKYADEEHIPYVYVQSTDDFREMLKYIQNSSQQFQGFNTTIDILSEEYWPLPWSLRDYKNVAWHAKVIDNPQADIEIGNKVNESTLDEKLLNYSKKEFNVRRGVDFVIYVKK